jgi:non-ribosomal peptide synthetase component F
MPDRATDQGAQAPGAQMTCGQDVPGWTPFARAEIEQTVFARFEHIANANAERAAVVTRAGSASYRELDNEANRIAHAIRDHADAVSGAIATLLDSDPRLAAAMLAIFKVGTSLCSDRFALPGGARRVHARRCRGANRAHGEAT